LQEGATLASGLVQCYGAALAAAAEAPPAAAAATAAGGSADSAAAAAFAVHAQAAAVESGAPSSANPFSDGPASKVDVAASYRVTSHPPIPVGHGSVGAESGDPASTPDLTGSGGVAGAGSGAAAASVADFTAPVLVRVAPPLTCASYCACCGTPTISFPPSFSAVPGPACCRLLLVPGAVTRLEPRSLLLRRQTSFHPRPPAAAPRAW
jgi:hypothetical protein